MCHFLGVLFCEKGAIIGIIFSHIYEIIATGTILGKCSKNCQEEQMICRSSLMISLRIEEISLHCRNMNIFHQFCGIMVALIQIWEELGVTNLTQNGTSPSKTLLS